MPRMSEYVRDKHVEVAARAAHEVLRSLDLGEHFECWTYHTGEAEEADAERPEPPWLELPEPVQKQKKEEAYAALLAAQMHKLEPPPNLRIAVWRAALRAASQVQIDWGGGWYGKSTLTVPR